MFVSQFFLGQFSSQSERFGQFLVSPVCIITQVAGRLELTSQVLLQLQEQLQVQAQLQVLEQLQVQT
jgi:hypothetical protein